MYRRNQSHRRAPIFVKAAPDSDIAALDAAIASGEHSVNEVSLELAGNVVQRLRVFCPACRHLKKLDDTTLQNAAKALARSNYVRLPCVETNKQYESFSRSKLRGKN